MGSTHGSTHGFGPLVDPWVDPYRFYSVHRFGSVRLGRSLAVRFGSGPVRAVGHKYCNSVRFGSAGSGSSCRFGSVPFDRFCSVSSVRFFCAKRSVRFGSATAVWFGSAISGRFRFGSDCSVWFVAFLGCLLKRRWPKATAQNVERGTSLRSKHPVKKRNIRQVIWCLSSHIGRWPSATSFLIDTRVGLCVLV